MESKLNQDYIRYEQVEKRQSYHLAEDAREEFDDERIMTLASGTERKAA